MSTHGASVIESSTSRIQSLRDKHMQYKNLIREARKIPSTTDFYLNQLKKQKLHIKEQLEEETRRKAS